MDFDVGCFLADAITSYHYIKKAEKIHGDVDKKIKIRTTLCMR